VYAHLPTVLNEQGEKMSKRNGAKPVTRYRDEGFLADAVVNYLARLGWSHGDDEVFSREQFVGWFNLDHLGKSAAQFDEAKLRWVNAQHIKLSSDSDLASLVREQLAKLSIASTDPELVPAIALFKDRCSTTAEIADWLAMYFAPIQPRAEDIAAYVTDSVRPALQTLRDKLAAIEWNKAAIAAAIKETIGAHRLKMPQLAHAVRVLVCGRAQTPSIDAVLELFPRETVVSRLRLA